MLVLISDGDYKTEEDPINEADDLKNMGVKIFTIGLGNWLRVGNLRILASSNANFGTVDEWRDMVANNPTTISPSKCNCDYIYCGKTPIQCNSTAFIVH